MAALTVQDLCIAALFELGAQQAGSVPDGDEIQWVLSKLQRMMDAWRVQRQLIYNVSIAEYTLTANHQPHTIGPTTADFTVESRPTKVIAANIIINTSSPNVRQPLNILTDEQWMAITVRDISAALPGSLYYSPDMPNGKLYLWPKPNIAYGLELETWTLIDQFTALATEILLPPGYWDAIVYSLAESLIPSYPGCPSAGVVVEAAKRARTKIAVVNSRPQNLSSDAPSMGRGSAGTFNHWTGLIE